MATPAATESCVDADASDAAHGLTLEWHPASEENLEGFADFALNFLRDGPAMSSNNPLSLGSAARTAKRREDEREERR